MTVTVKLYSTVNAVFKCVKFFCFIDFINEKFKPLPKVLIQVLWF